MMLYVCAVGSKTAAMMQQEVIRMVAGGYAVVGSIIR